MSDKIALLPRLFEQLGENQIRILVLYPSKDRNRPLLGRHDVQTLTKKDDVSRAPDWKEYTALSYVWGDSAKTEWLTLDTGILSIRSNLHQALLEIRQDTEEIRLWVDAVCINQGDRQERRSQVSLMADIYSNAELIAIWLVNDNERVQDLKKLVMSSGRTIARYPYYVVARNHLGKTITPARISFYDWAYRLWAAYMKLSVLSDIRILCGAVELSCNSRGGFSLLCNGRVLQVKRVKLKRVASGGIVLTQPVVTQVAGTEHALPFKDQNEHPLLDDRRSAMQQGYPRRNKELKPRVKPRDCITSEEFSFPRTPKSPKSSKRKNLMLWVKRTHLSIDERYDSGNARCEAPVDTSIETKGIASEQTGLPRVTEQPASEERTIRDHKMFWTCTCGHKGLDHYIEYRSGSVRELLQSLHDAGIYGHIEPWDPLQPGRFAISHAVARFSIIVSNIRGRILACTVSFIRRYPVRLLPKDPTEMVQTPWDTAEGKRPYIETTAGQTPRAYFPTTSPQIHGTTPSLLFSGKSGAPSANTMGQYNQSSSSSTICTSTNTTHVNIREDFILLCMRVKKFLTSRHDVGVSGITCDRELFQAFRNEYNSKFGRIYRRFSLRTAQRMSFVKFVLHPRSEVDGLMADMPPDTVKHYTCDPRKPDHIPAIGSDILMHRFTSPEACFHDEICLNQMPKRVGERPTPGIDPDFYTGWGIHIEEGLNFERICFLLFFGIVSGGTFGIVWAICKKSLQDGFVVAGFIVGTEAIAVASLQLLLAFETK